MTSSKLLYIQKVVVHLPMVELYQQFLDKLVVAQKKNGNEQSWTVYEPTFTTIRNTREFVFIREMDSWAEIDEMEKEDPLAKIIMEYYGDKEGVQWLNIAQKAVKSVSTSVLSKMEQFS